MHKQRNAVERSLLEFSQQLKTTITQRLYAALAEVNVDRDQAKRVLAIVIGTIDETTERFAKPFDKSIEALVKAFEESRKTDSKSK